MGSINHIERSVNFSYYQVVLNKGFVEENFDLTDWMYKMEDIALEERGTYVYDDVIRYDNGLLDYNDIPKISTLHFTKLRKNEAPAVGTLESPILKDVSLNINEFIAEDVSALFDSNNYILMLQKNIYSLSVAAVEQYINFFWNKDRALGTEELIELRPVFEKDTFEKGKKLKTYKSISLKTADLASSNSMNFLGGRMGAILDSIKEVDGVTIELKISAGRKKNAELNSEEIRTWITEIQNNQSEFKRVSVSSKDSGKTELLELLENRVKSVLNFKIQAKKILEPKDVQCQMFNEYYRNGKKDYILRCIGG